MSDGLAVRLISATHLPEIVSNCPWCRQMNIPGVKRAAIVINRLIKRGKCGSMPRNKDEFSIRKYEKLTGV